MRLAWLLVLGACSEAPEVPPLGNVPVSRVFHEEIPLAVNANLDVLFVIDSSPAMAAFETKLAGNDRELIQLLTPAFGPDLHVGVVTADPADAGKLREIASVAGSFVTTTLQFDTTVQTNVTGPIDDAFVALADVGAAGTESVQPLAMAQAALAPGANPGFLRDDAALGIVIVTATDDSSAGAVDDYVTAFEQLKAADPTRVVVSVASGPCTTTSLSAPATPRLSTLVGQFPNRGSQVAICDDNLDALVSLELQVFTVPLGEPCIDVPLASPPECAFWVQSPMTAEQRVVEPCPSSTIPCWSLIAEPQNCPAPQSLSPHLEPGNFRGTNAVNGVGATEVEEIECVIE